MSTPQQLEKVVRWTNHIAGRNRKGETCTMLVVRGDTSGMVQVRFPDGETAIVDRRALTETGKTRSQRQ